MTLESSNMIFPNEKILNQIKLETDARLVAQATAILGINQIGMNMFGFLLAGIALITSGIISVLTNNNDFINEAHKLGLRIEDAGLKSLAVFTIPAILSAIAAAPAKMHLVGGAICKKELDLFANREPLHLLHFVCQQNILCIEQNDNTIRIKSLCMKFSLFFSFLAFGYAAVEVGMTIPV